MSEPAEEPTTDDDARREGQISEGASAFGDSETATGGADAVPDTPDVNPGTPEPIEGVRD